MTDFQTGLLVSAIGMSVTFLALGIFIGVIVLLQKLFPPKPESAEDEGEGSEETVVMAVESESGAEEIAAAIAAVTYLRSRRSGQLGASLLSGPGLYRTTR